MGKKIKQNSTYCVLPLRHLLSVSMAAAMAAQTKTTAPGLRRVAPTPIDWRAFWFARDPKREPNAGVEWREQQSSYRGTCQVSNAQHVQHKASLVRRGGERKFTLILW